MSPQFLVLFCNHSGAFISVAPIIGSGIGKGPICQNGIGIGYK